MDNITLPMDSIKENGLTINEYLLLYDVVNQYSISNLLGNGAIIPTLLSLEKKGFVKLNNNEIFLREKASVLFSVKEDLFVKWLNTYPTMVKKRHGGKRSLSPASADTILGKRLAKKWKVMFKSDIKAQEKAILVLEVEVRDKRRSGDLEYMVEASRWLNEGYHEKYSFLVDDGIVPENKYSNEDYL